MSSTEYPPGTSRSCTVSTPAPPAEYVLIGSSHRLEDLALAFGELEVDPRHRQAHSNTQSNPATTIEISTVRIRVWQQSDGRRLVEVHDHRSSRPVAVLCDPRDPNDV